MIIFEGGEATFGHPAASDILKNWVLEQLNASSVQSNLHILDQLLQLMEWIVDQQQQTTEEHSSNEYKSPQSLIDLSCYAAQFWSVYYKAAANDESTRKRAEDSLRHFLANKAAVRFYLNINGASIAEYTTRWSKDTGDPRVALVVKGGLDLRTIIRILELMDRWLAEPKLVYLAFLGALKGQGLSLITEFLPNLSLLDNKAI